MPEAQEFSDDIVEAGHREAHSEADDLRFRRRVGLLIGLLACLLAITSMGGSNMMKRTINANIEASDAYAFYQAKTLRQEVLHAASDELDVLRQAVPSLPAAAGAFIDQRQAAYRASIAHWESSPASNDGKKELLEQAKAAGARRAEAARRDEWFELAEAMLQIAVVIASTSILTASRRLLALCVIFSGAGIFCLISAFADFFPVPFEF